MFRIRNLSYVLGSNFNYYRNTGSSFLTGLQDQIDNIFKSPCPPRLRV